MSLPNSNTRLLTYADAIREGVQQQMRSDPSVFVLGLDVDDHKAILGTTRGLVEEFGTERVLTTPMSEDAATGIAIGAAMAGLRPVHVHIRMDFLMLCMNQLINIAAKAHYMYGGTVKVPLVVRCIIGKSWGQGAQHSQALHAMFMHVPGLRVVAPSNAYDAKGCLISSIRDNNPVIFVEHRQLYMTETDVPTDQYKLPLGQARTCAHGGDITIVGISGVVMDCLRARELLEQVGISAEVIDPIWLAPLDRDSICKSVQRTGRLLVVDNGWTSCGAGAEILASVMETEGASAVAMRRMGFAPVTCPTTKILEDAFYPNPVTIASNAHSLVYPDAKKWEPDVNHATLSPPVPFRGPF